MFKNKYLYVIVPHRGVYAGKSRLAGVLSEAARGQLNHWLLVRTLGVVRAWLGDTQRCVVVSPCEVTLALARRAGAIALPEHARTRGLNAALSQAAAHAASRGAQRLLILPCDLPRLDIAAMESMLTPAVLGTEVVIAFDRHDEGTNALLVDADVRKFGFGKHSLARHIEQAKARGVRAFPAIHPALAFDLDTPEDFAEWVRSGNELPPFLMPRAA